MRAIIITEGHPNWDFWKNPGYYFTVVIMQTDNGTEYPADLMDTKTEMAARTLADAVNLGVYKDWKDIYGQHN